MPHRYLKSSWGSSKKEIKLETWGGKMLKWHVELVQFATCLRGLGSDTWGGGRGTLALLASEVCGICRDANPHVPGLVLRNKSNLDNSGNKGGTRGNISNESKVGERWQQQRVVSRQVQPRAGAGVRGKFLACCKRKRCLEAEAMCTLEQHNFTSFFDHLNKGMWKITV